jgi:hypothetical protein
MSIAAMKKKANNNNPRLGPQSGSNNNNFFSLNGTRRNIGQVGPTNLAPTAQTGPTQQIATAPNSLTFPGINGHPSSVCTNDPTVVKSSVINTRGMLSRRTNGLSRNPPTAPVRQENGCSYGPIEQEAQPFPECPGKVCPPIWVKNPVLPNGNQGQYINVVALRGNSSQFAGFCDIRGYDCETEARLSGLSIEEAQVKCKNLESNFCGKITTDWEALPKEYPIRRVLGSGKSRFRSCNVTKDVVNRHCNGTSLNVISQSEYARRNLLINNCLPQSGLNNPIPRPFSNQNSECRLPNAFNVNIPPFSQLNSAFQILSNYLKTQLPNYSICLIGNSETIEQDLGFNSGEIFKKPKFFSERFEKEKKAVNLINSLNIILIVRNKPQLHEVAAVPNLAIPLLEQKGYGIPVMFGNGLNILAFGVIANAGGAGVRGFAVNYQQTGSVRQALDAGGDAAWDVVKSNAAGLAGAAIGCVGGALVGGPGGCAAGEAIGQYGATQLQDYANQEGFTA